ncbi:NADPH oxidase activator 1 isoform X3 [Haemorhous mexicanus]|uniref:NADPH oxidase activator 1 isoform X3 n=1 Tax=Haemorhous mexicanus TaxID=30427 RepID=UPI0028BE146C|nr:NADPH oxidase activator 1 isoform X3 [Haemorhous mexicanus]
MSQCGVRVPFRARCVLPPPRGGAERAEAAARSRPAPAGAAQVRRGRSAGAAPRGSVPVPGARSRSPAMAYRELVRLWHEAVRAADRGHWDAALDAFGGIAEPPARICFNVGCVQLLAGRPEAALRGGDADKPFLKQRKEELRLCWRGWGSAVEPWAGSGCSAHGAMEAFDKTIEKDNSLAVGYFQRGFVYLQLEMYEEALSDYHMAFSHLRENPFIDYKQLGLRHILYAWEVLYSAAAVQCHQQQWQEARVTLEKAVVWRPERRTAMLELALERVQDHLFLEPMLVPLGELFRPRKKEVEQLDSKDFLGKPKVISSIIPNDEYIGFEPLRPQKQGFYEPSANALRDAESGYHRVLSRYRPDEPPGPEVAAGSLVFVLGRAADGWATAIHDGQKLHIPSSLLEPASRMDKWKISTGIPLPPAQVPPSCHPVKQKPDPPGEENASVNDASAHMDSKVPPRCGEASAGADRPAVLRLRCECSLVLWAGEAPALPALRALLRDRLAQQAQRGMLSYRLLDGTELGTVLGQEDLGKVWQQLTEGSLILCCQDSDSHSGRPVLYQMLAQHSYLAQGPGDLEFNKGDVLDILSEVNEDWLEGRCNGKTGIFPKCFATQTSCDAAFL